MEDASPTVDVYRWNGDCRPAAAGLPPEPGSPAATPAGRRSRVAVELDGALEASRALSRLVAELESRLKPLIPPHPGRPASSGEGPYTPMSPLAGALNGLAYALDDAAARLAFLLGRVEI